MATIKIKQIGSPIRRPKAQKQILIGPGPGQDAPRGRARGHRRSARCDRRPAAHGESDRLTFLLSPHAGEEERYARQKRKRVHDMKLNEIKDNDGARKGRMRVGRASARARARTAGRGQKGAKARSGVAINGFEGGQMPLHMRLPKRGFNNPFGKDYAVVNLGMVQKSIDAGKLDAKAVIDQRRCARPTSRAAASMACACSQGRTDREGQLLGGRCVQVGDRGSREGRRQGRDYRSARPRCAGQGQEGHGESKIERSGRSPDALSCITGPSCRYGRAGPIR